MTEGEEYKKIIERIKEKMEDPKLRKKVDDAIDTIEDVFETPIDVSIQFMVGVEEYKEILENYEEEEMPSEFSDEIMTLNDLKSLIEEESDFSYKLCIDPIYLKGGINKINNMLVTTYNDSIILVPTIEKENE